MDNLNEVLIADVADIDSEVWQMQYDIYHAYQVRETLLEDTSTKRIRERIKQGDIELEFLNIPEQYKSLFYYIDSVGEKYKRLVVNQANRTLELDKVLLNESLTLVLGIKPKGIELLAKLGNAGFVPANVTLGNIESIKAILSETSVRKSIE